MKHWKLPTCTFTNRQEWAKVECPCFLRGWSHCAPKGWESSRKEVSSEHGCFKLIRFSTEWYPFPFSAGTLSRTFSRTKICCLSSPTALRTVARIFCYVQTYAYVAHSARKPTALNRPHGIFAINSRSCPDQNFLSIRRIFRSKNLTCWNDHFQIVEQKKRTFPYCYFYLSETNLRHIVRLGAFASIRCRSTTTIYTFTSEETISLRAKFQFANYAINWQIL